MKPTEGKLFSFGLSSQTQGNEIRKITNVCPQFDILWPELTVYDHAKLVCQLKGIQGGEIEGYAYELMTSVNLEDCMNVRIENLSGGMMRRVSIALATIGEPKVKNTSKTKFSLKKFKTLKIEKKN